MEPADVIQLLQVLDDIQLLLTDIKVIMEVVVSGTFMLSGVMVGVMLMFIFFFFLKGAE